MLRSLRVRDLATVADVSLDLGPGLNVLTGETGAGKSMLVDALALLLGDRADRAAVRTGAARAVVDGAFDAASPELAARLDAAGLDIADQVVIRREVSAEGRSRAWVNGSPTTIGVLAEIGAHLLDLHGQHQSLELTQAATQRRLLDAHGDAGDELDAVRAAHAALLAVREEHQALAARRDEALRRADWLRHVVDEIDAARIRPGEDETLAREAGRLAQAGVLGAHAREALALLDAEDAGVRDRLGRLARVFDQLARRDETVTGWRELLDGAWASLDELSRRLAEYADEVAEDPDRLTTLERRRDLLGDLMRRHGGTLDAVLETRRSAGEELDLLDRAALDLAGLARREADAAARLAAAAAALTTRRTRAAERLAGEVTRLLPSLGLVDGELLVQLTPVDPIAADGAEQVTFRARLNRGHAERPIAQAASGGELSRLMLALKVALARHDEVPTLVFDEIDQGIGGETGGHVGAALARLSHQHQVLVITHLPQIAARADRHLVVQKGDRGGIATSDVRVLHGEDRVVELARMLGSADDANARRLALSLLSAAVSD
ncbi:MAG: DNA repair protein RecN [Gemmatimonadales bacterium]